MDDKTLKLKRQVRDYYNKHVNDEDTIEEVAKVIGFPLPDNMNICIWPDDTWCMESDLEMYGWTSDDYAIVSIPVELTLDEVHALVSQFNKTHKESTNMSNYHSFDKINWNTIGMKISDIDKKHKENVQKVGWQLQSQMYMKQRRKRNIRMAILSALVVTAVVVFKVYC